MTFLTETFGDFRREDSFFPEDYLVLALACSLYYLLMICSVDCSRPVCLLGYFTLPLSCETEEPSKASVGAHSTWLIWQREDDGQSSSILGRLDWQEEPRTRTGMLTRANALCVTLCPRGFLFSISFISHNLFYPQFRGKENECKRLGMTWP